MQTKITDIDANSLYGLYEWKTPVDDFMWEIETNIVRVLANPLAYLEELDKEWRGCFVMGDFHIPGWRNSQDNSQLRS